MSDGEPFGEMMGIAMHTVPAPAHPAARVAVSVTGWPGVLAAVLGGVGQAAGDPNQAAELELRDALDRLRGATGSDGIMLLELAPAEPRLVALAGEIRMPERMRDMVDAARADQGSAVIDRSVALLGGDAPELLLVIERIAIPAPSVLERAMLRSIMPWLAAERRRCERLVRWVEDTRDDKYASLSRLAVRAGHDFRNTLAAIMSHAEFVLDRIDEDHVVHRDLEDVVLAAREAAAQVDELMAFGGLLDRPNPEPLDLTKPISGMMPVLRALVPEHIGLDTTIQSGAAAGIAPSHLRQLLVNLVGNAAEAIGAHPGRIELRVEKRLGPAPSVVLRVDDDGPGMEPNVVRRAADPFFTTRKGSRGLGLAIAMGIARGVGGRLEIESAPGLGTSVRVHIPSRAKPTNRIV